MIKVSVIMSTYNTPEKFLREAIESILNQSLKEIELIIVDDGSTQQDSQIVNSYEDSRIVLLSNINNKGLPYSLNRAINVSRGKYIARMDSDDIAYEKRLEIQYEYMEKNPKCSVLGTCAKRFGNRKGLIGAPAFYKSIDFYLFFKNCVIHPSVMMRKSFLYENQLMYDEEFKKSQDFELWSRVCQIGEIHIIPYTLLKYRHHGGQAATHPEIQMEYGFRVYKKMFEKIGYHLTQEENILHYCLVNAQYVDSVENLIKWSDKLKNLNFEYNMFPIKAFNNYVNHYLEYNLVKFLVLRKYHISNSLLKKILNPRMIYCMIDELLRIRIENFKVSIRSFYNED